MAQGHQAIDARPQTPMDPGTGVLSEGKEEKAGYTAYTRHGSASTGEGV